MTNNQPSYGQNLYPQQQQQNAIYQNQLIYNQPMPMYNQPIDPYQAQPYYNNNTPGYYQNQSQGPIIVHN